MNLTFMSGKELIMGQEASLDLLLTLPLGAGLIMSGESTAVLQTIIRGYQIFAIFKPIAIFSTVLN